jgi:general secretion pathway protein F
MPIDSPKAQRVTLEELLALNDEIIALVRAGVPLESGLADLGQERTGALGRISSRLASRLSHGESLAEALGHEEFGLPRSYRIVVEAGLRAGKLTAALEGLSQMAWRVSDLRRRIGLALVYPLIVLMLAYGLFVLLCTQLAPRMQYFFDDIGLRTGLYEWLIDLGRYANPWGWVFPAVVVGLILWWRRAGDRGFLSDDNSTAKFAWLCPGLGKILKYLRYSQFADLLALLVENDVALQEAVVLSAETTSDLALQDAARAIADATSRGMDASYGLSNHSGFPPFLHWLITRRQEQEGLVSALRAAGDMYRRRAIAITDWIKVTFPVLAAIILGGGATLLYTLSIFGPMAEMLKRLASPMI